MAGAAQPFVIHASLSCLGDKHPQCHSLQSAAPQPTVKQGVRGAVTAQLGPASLWSPGMESQGGPCSVVDQGQSSGKNMASGVQRCCLLAGDPPSSGPQGTRGALVFCDLSTPPLEKALGFCPQEWELAYFARMYCFPNKIHPSY